MAWCLGGNRETLFLIYHQIRLKISALSIANHANSLKLMEHFFSQKLIPLCFHNNYFRIKLKSFKPSNLRFYRCEQTNVCVNSSKEAFFRFRYQRCLKVSSACTFKILFANRLSMSRFFKFIDDVPTNLFIIFLININNVKYFTYWRVNFSFHYNFSGSQWCASSPV